MPRKMRVEYPGAIYHVMSRGDQRDDIFQEDVDRHDFIRTLAEACQKTNHPIKLALAARLRQETTLSVTQIAERLHLGSPKGARANLHKFMNNSQVQTVQTKLNVQ